MIFSGAFGYLFLLSKTTVKTEKNDNRHKTDFLSIISPELQSIETSLKIMLSAISVNYDCWYQQKERKSSKNIVCNKFVAFVQIAWNVAGRSTGYVISALSINIDLPHNDNFW